MSGPELVVILNTNSTRPTYHCQDDVIWDEGRHVGVTACGRRDHSYRWWEARLRREHADLFARPCATCYPAVTP